MKLERTDITCLIEILSALPMVATYDLLVRVYGERKASQLVKHLIHLTLPKLKATPEVKSIAKDSDV